MGGFFIPAASATTNGTGAVLSVDGFTPVANASGTVGYASADGTFADGWRWVFYVTVPTNETILNMKFDDWMSGANSIPAGSNIQFYSAQSTNAFNEAHAIAINATKNGVGVYGGAMNLNPGKTLMYQQWAGKLR